MTVRPQLRGAGLVMFYAACIGVGAVAGVGIAAVVLWRRYR